MAWLKAKGATRAEVVRELPSGSIYYEKGTPNWDALIGFLAREPPTDYVPIREAVKRYSRVVHHTTAWTQTWIFFDDQDVIREYYFGSQ